MQRTHIYQTQDLNISNLAKSEKASLAKGNFSTLVLQESTSSLKNKNDVFGFTKKSEKILEKILYILTMKETDYKEQIQDIAQNSFYKDMNILENIFQDKSGKTVNLKEKIFTLLEQENTNELKELINIQIRITKNLLEKIKQDIQSTANTMSRRSIGNMQDIIKDINNGSINYKLKELLR